jgi:hypothetical protein
MVIEDQPLPVEGEGDMWREVIEDMEERRKVGIERYGKPVQMFNGRDNLRDLYEELLDGAVYCKVHMRQMREEMYKAFCTGFSVAQIAEGRITSADDLRAYFDYWCPND